MTEILESRDPKLFDGIGNPVVCAPIFHENEMFNPPQNFFNRWLEEFLTILDQLGNPQQLPPPNTAVKGNTWVWFSNLPPEPANAGINLGTWLCVKHPTKPLAVDQVLACFDDPGNGERFYKQTGIKPRRPTEIKGQNGETIIDISPYIIEQGSPAEAIEYYTYLMALRATLTFYIRGISSTLEPTNRILESINDGNNENNLDYRLFAQAAKKLAYLLGIIVDDHTTIRETLIQLPSFHLPTGIRCRLSADMTAQLDSAFCALRHKSLFPPQSLLYLELLQRYGENLILQGEHKGMGFNEARLLRPSEFKNPWIDSNRLIPFWIQGKRRATIEDLIKPWLRLGIFINRFRDGLSIGKKELDVICAIINTVCELTGRGVNVISGESLLYSAH